MPPPPGKTPPAAPEKSAKNSLFVRAARALRLRHRTPTFANLGERPEGPIVGIHKPALMIKPDPQPELVGPPVGGQIEGRGTGLRQFALFQLGYRQLALLKCRFFCYLPSQRAITKYLLAIVADGQWDPRRSRHPQTTIPLFRKHDDRVPVRLEKLVEEQN